METHYEVISTIYICSQLKDGYASNVIPTEVPELVRVLLAQYPEALDCGRRQQRKPLYISMLRLMLYINYQCAPLGFLFPCARHERWG